MIADSVSFIVIGSIMPFDAWNNAPSLGVGRLLGLGLLIMLLRRIPATILFAHFIPDLKTFREAMFVSHFGPVALGALYFALTSAQELPADSEIRTVVIPVVMFIILTSIIVHGCSAPLSLLASQIPRRFVRQVLSEKTDEEENAEEGGEGASDERSRLLDGPAALVPGRVARELADKSQGAISRSRLDTIIYRGRSRKKRHSRRAGEQDGDAEAARPPPQEQEEDGDQHDGDGGEDEDESDEDPREPYAGTETKKDRDKRRQKEEAKRAKTGQRPAPPAQRRSGSPTPSEDSLHELHIYDEGGHIVIEYADGTTIARKVKDD